MNGGSGGSKIIVPRFTRGQDATGKIISLKRISEAEKTWIKSTRSILGNAKRRVEGDKSRELMKIKNINEFSYLETVAAADTRSFLLGRGKKGTLSIGFGLEEINLALERVVDETDYSGNKNLEFTLWYHKNRLAMLYDSEKIENASFLKLDALARNREHMFAGLYIDPNGAPSLFTSNTLTIPLIHGTSEILKVFALLDERAAVLTAIAFNAKLMQARAFYEERLENPSGFTDEAGSRRWVSSLMGRMGSKAWSAEEQLHPRAVKIICCTALLDPLFKSIEEVARSHVEFVESAYAWLSPENLNLLKKEFVRISLAVSINRLV